MGDTNEQKSIRQILNSVEKYVLDRIYNNNIEKCISYFPNLPLQSLIKSGLYGLPFLSMRAP